MKGYIAIHRKIKNHWLYKKEGMSKKTFSRFEAWIDLLLTANHDEAQVPIGATTYTIKRGEQIRSLRTLSLEWNWSINKVRRFLTLLQNDNMVVFKSDTQTTSITILNYDTYQSERNTNGTQTEHERNTNGTRTETNNNVYNVDTVNKPSSSLVKIDSDESIPTEAMDVAEYLYESIKKWDTTHKYNRTKPSLKSWAKDIDKAIRIDGRDAESLKHMIHYLFNEKTQTAIFWAPNVQSGKTLREKFDTVKQKAYHEHESRKKTKGSYDPVAINETIRKALQGSTT